MKIKFTKMHGIGNDFIIINQLKDQYNLNSTNIKSLSHRQFGIGFDQLLIIEASSNPKADELNTATLPFGAFPGSKRFD